MTVLPGTILHLVSKGPNLSLNPLGGPVTEATEEDKNEKWPVLALGFHRLGFCNVWLRAEGKDRIRQEH
jgi:hypothetical protein